MTFTKRIFMVISFVVFSAILLGCREITTITTINSDGSVERIVKVKSKHQSHNNSYFPIPTDSTWTITNTKSKQDTEFYNYTATRIFHDIADLQSFYRGFADTSAVVGIDIEFKNRLGVFYRYYRYREIYKRYSPYDKIPIDDYLSDEEIEIYLSGRDSSEIEDKVEKWRARAMFEELYQAMVTKLKSLAIPELRPENFKANKDTLFAAIIEKADSTDEVLRELSKILQTNAVNGLEDTIDTVLQQIDRDLEGIMGVGTNDYTNQVLMPGLLLDTNADAVEGNMASWNFSGEVFEFRDKQMWVESRSINWWGIGLSGALVLVLIGLLIAVARVRKP